MARYALNNIRRKRTNTIACTSSGPYGKNGALLNRDEDIDLAGYPAGFRFSRNSQWLVRMQKLGAGYHTLFLYRRTGD